MSLKQPHQEGGPNMVRVVERNIHALLARRQADDRALGWQDRLAERITRFTGSMLFVGLHVVLYGAWILLNAGWIPHFKPFDPTFVMLAMEASVEAIFLSTFILITQNRMMALADRRADLNLQISLLAEHEVTRLIQMVAEMAKRMGIESARDPELAELSQDVRPEKVLETIERKEREFSGDGS
jgi:uncharacterized membrane protein